MTKEAKPVKKRFTTTMRDDETPEEFHARGGISLEGDTVEEFIELGKAPEEREWRRKYAQREISPQAIAKHYKELSGSLEENIGEMDVEILPVCRELNAKGYETYASCAGHWQLGEGYASRGYLSFKNVRGGEFTDGQEKEIRGVLAKYGIGDIEFEKGDWQDKAWGEVRVNFDARGEARETDEDVGSLPQLVPKRKIVRRKLRTKRKHTQPTISLRGVR